MKKIKLGEPFYLNILLLGDTEKYPIWVSLFDAEFCGSPRRNEAVELRRKYQTKLNKQYKVWPKWKFKTIKIRKRYKNKNRDLKRG